MKTFLNTFNWAVGIFLILMGILFMIDEVYQSIPLFIASLLFLPPVRTFFSKFVKIEISFLQKTGVLIILILVFGLLVASNVSNKTEIEKKKRAEMLAEVARQQDLKRIEEFNNNRTAILSDFQTLIDNKKYDEVIQASKEYVGIEDEKLSSFIKIAKDQIRAKKNETRAKKILADLKTIPVSDYNKNMQLYKTLHDMYPDNEKYKSKLSYYSKKIQQRKEVSEKKANRRKKIERQFSSWNGSHINLTKMIKMSMNDPGSYKHAKTVYWDNKDHLIVKTTFRGKNGFGGMVLNTISAKVDLNGNVIKILSQN